VIISFFVVEKTIQESTKETKTIRRKEVMKNPKNNDALMTDAQKRYLFRILADQEKEGEEAMNI